jgi:flagellar basal-body rod modification protein FlgD
MASVSSITSATSAATIADTTAARIPQKALGQNDFLKLLAKQYQSQDPLKPKDDTAFIADMAQFSALEQSKATGDLLASLRSDQMRATANSYLGHRVTVDAGKDGTVSGGVGAIDVSGPEPRLVVGDRTFPLSAVLRVEPGVVSAPAPVPVNAGGTQS